MTYRDPKTGRFISNASFARRVPHVQRTIIARAGWETRRRKARARERITAERAKERKTAQAITEALAFKAAESELSPGFAKRSSFSFDVERMLVKVTFRTPKYDRRVTGKIIKGSRPSTIKFKWTTITHKRR